MAFKRTLRVPDDGKTYPLPPGLGHFPVHKVSDYADRVPPEWNKHGGVFVPMHQCEAMWISFDVRRTCGASGVESSPWALKVGVGKINAISGEPWSKGLSKSPQDYVVTPRQPVRAGC